MSKLNRDELNLSMNGVFERVVKLCKEQMQNKGNKRHTNYSLPYTQQEWYVKGNIFKWGNGFQASKKLQETVVLYDTIGKDKARDELIGAINYAMYQLIILDDEIANDNTF